MDRPRRCMRELMRVAKALADENRVRILMALRGGELCVCQLIRLLGLAPSSVSKHVSLLYQAGLADSRKDGRWVYYRLPGRKAPAAVSGALGWMMGAAGRAPEFAGDGARLRAIRAMDPRELCKAYQPSRLRGPRGAATKAS